MKLVQVNKITTSNIPHNSHTLSEFISLSINLVISYHVSNNSSYWIIDSRVNDHVCSSMYLLESFYHIRCDKVHLPNGKLSKLSMFIMFNSLITFYINIIYSYKFKLNLIFMSKLCQSLTCSLKFIIDHCSVNYMKSLRKIGLNNQVNGLLN